MPRVVHIDPIRLALFRRTQPYGKPLSQIRQDLGHFSLELWRAAGPRAVDPTLPARIDENA